MTHIPVDVLTARLREHRERFDLTQDQAAEELARLAWEREGVRLGVDGSMVSKWERAGSARARPTGSCCVCSL
jgi:transcriptional regulator with XRE-family HTH domain